jgi:hypothetical protein
MPSIAAHYYFGQEILKKINKDNSEIGEFIHNCRAVFNLGLQGPDLLFYYKPYMNNKINILGEEIHFRPARDLVGSAAVNIRQEKSNAALGYLMGLACHFVLDSGLHGEITQYAPDIREHLLLEAEMDRQIIKGNYSSKPHTFNRYQLVKSTNKKWDFLKLVYPQIEARHLKECVNSMGFYLMILFCRWDIKKKLLEFAEGLSGKKGPFTALIVDSKENKHFQPYAKKLCCDMKDIVSDGLLAVENIYETTIYNAPLNCMFNRNFG